MSYDRNNNLFKIYVLHVATNKYLCIYYTYTIKALKMAEIFKE